MDDQMPRPELVDGVVAAAADTIEAAVHQAVDYSAGMANIRCATHPQRPTRRRLAPLLPRPVIQRSLQAAAMVGAAMAVVAIIGVALLPVTLAREPSDPPAGSPLSPAPPSCCAPTAASANVSAPVRTGGPNGPAPPPAGSAPVSTGQVAAASEPSGPLQQNKPGRVTVPVTNTTDAALTNLVANLTFPPGVGQRGGVDGFTANDDLGDPSSPGAFAAAQAAPRWSCTETTANSVRCTLSSLAAGESSVLEIKIKAGKDATSGTITGDVAAGGVTVRLGQTYVEVQPR